MADTATARSASVADDDARGALLSECRRIEEYAKWNASTHFTASAFAMRAHAIVGVIPIVLGGLGTWSGLKLIADQSTATVVASVAALLAGLVGSILSFWNLSEVRQKHFKAGTAYKTLENEARRAHSVFIDATDDDLRETVKCLADRYDRLGEESAQTSDLAFSWASRKVRAGKYDPDQGKREQG